MGQVHPKDITPATRDGAEYILRELGVAREIDSRAGIEDDVPTKVRLVVMQR